MDYESEELKNHKKVHKKNLKIVLNELLQTLRTSTSKRNIHRNMSVSHEYIEFLKHIDYRMHLKNLYPDLVASIGSKHGLIELKGPGLQVEKALVMLREKIQKISAKHLTSSQSSLVWNIVAKNAWNDYFSRQLGEENIQAKVCVGASQSLSILASNSEECERAFGILFECLREDTMSITKDCSVQSDEFQSLFSKLERGNLIKIEPDIHENLIKIFGTEEAIIRATKEIYDFIDADRIRSETHRPHVSRHIWNFLARRVDHESVLQIAKDLEQFGVSIQLADDHEQFFLCGSNEGLVRCKKRLSELVATIVEREKKLEFSGVKKFFLDSTGKEQLQMIEKEMCVDIEIVHIGKKISKAPVPIPRTLSLPSKIRKDSVNETLKAPVPLPRTRFTPSKTPEDCIYDICNFTTAEGIKVSWKYGSIENETADVLVNSAHSNLNKPTACGRALMLRGGACYVEACEPYKHIGVGDIAVTKSGNLSSEYVIHAVCCNLSQFKEGQSAHEFLKQLVRRIFEKCQELGVSSLAMPMIGAGQHGFSAEAVLKVIKNEVNHIGSKNVPQLTLKDVRVIVFQTKGNAGRRQSVPLPIKPPRSSVVSKSYQDETNTTTSSTEIAFGSVRILLCQGNVTQYEAHALMNLSSTNVSTTTSRRANVRHSDDEIDLTAEKPIEPPPGTVLVTAASNSPNVRYYTHCVPVSFDISGLESAMKACLDAAKFFALKSIIISATGMASFKVSANECAKVILKVSEIFSIAKYAMEIRVVVFCMDMIRIFKTAFGEKAKEQITSIKFHESDQSASSEDKMQLRIGRKEEVIFRVVGFQDNVNLSIERIEAYLNGIKEKRSIKGEKMVEDLRKHKSEIMKLLKTHDVLITTSSEEIFIEGIGRQVFESKDVLVDFLNKHDEQEREAKRLREISEYVQWSYSDGSGFVLFDEILNGMIETEFKAGNEKFTIARTESYEIDLDAKIIRDCTTGHTAQLTRKHVENTLDLPKFWEPQPKGQDVHLVELSSSSNEYQKVIDLFVSEMDLMIVQSIQRIQNSRLYKMYLGKKESMGMEANERQLFHGTKTENISSINTNNFNRRFSGINGTKYGHGVYFARDASYSVRYSQKNSEDNDGLAHMYVAKVLVGKSVKGNSKMRVLPKRNDPLNPELWYDSAVDNTENPTIFVTFDDHQCYPEYLITFKVAQLSVRYTN